MSSGPNAERPRASRVASLLFLGRFLVLLVILYAGIAWRPVNDRIIVPFNSAVASVSAVVLRAIGEPVTVTGTTISGGGFSVDIENGCNGLEAAILLVSAMLAFPAPWRSRLLGVAVGFLAIQVVNPIRVVSLFWVGRHHPSLFSTSHTVIWQSVVVLFAVVVFFVWAARQRRPAAEEG